MNEVSDSRSEQNASSADGTPNSRVAIRGAEARVDDFQRPVKRRQPETVAPAGEHHAAELRHDGDDGVEHRQINRAAYHPRQRRAAELGDHIADRIGLFGHLGQRRRADQQGGERHQFHQHYDDQRQHDRDRHRPALFAHVFRHVHRRAVAVVGEQRDPDHGDDRRQRHRRRLPCASSITGAVRISVL